MKKRILAVDDEPDILKTIKYALEYDGYEVDAADSAEACFKALDKQKPDLVLLDLRLPGMSGFQIARDIKKRRGFENLPIVIVSSMTEESSKYMAAKSGAIEFIEKPVDIEKLRFHLQDILKTRN